MKKGICVIVILAAMVSLTSCTDDFKSIFKTEGFDKYFEGKESSYPRTIDISEGIRNDGMEFEYYVDLDFDGEDEEIEIEIENQVGDVWCSIMEISVGDYEDTVDIEYGTIDAVYVCDIDEDDGVRDLAIITNEMSDDPVLRIMNYKFGLPKYSFISDYDNEPYEENWIGYAVSYYFNVNDDDSITIEEQTPSAGMWSVYKTYYRNSAGHFVERKPDYYEILPDFMERGPIITLIGEELAKWNDGYIQAHTYYTSNGFTLYEGEYFKVLYDDGYNNIYVEKENGEAGWINIDYNMNTYELNASFFYLAG